MSNLEASGAATALLPPGLLLEELTRRGAIQLVLPERLARLNLRTPGV